MEIDKPNLFFKNYNSVIYKNVIKPFNLSNRRLIPEVINGLKRLYFKFGHRKIIVDLEEVSAVYPYPTVPIAGYIHYFKNELNTEFEFINVPTYLKKIHFLSPDEIDKTTTGRGTNFLDRVWVFKSSDDVHTHLLMDFWQVLEKTLKLKKVFFKLVNGVLMKLWIM